MTSLILVVVLSAGIDAPGPRRAETPLVPIAGSAPQVDETVPERPPIATPVPALCARGEHYLEDASLPALPRARGLFESAIEHYPEAACGHAGLSRALLALYQRRVVEDDALIGRSVEEARQAARLDPNLAIAHAALAGALLADLQIDEAERSAERSLSLDPASIPGLQAAATVRLARGRLETARAAIDAAIRIEPGLPASYLILGNVQLLAGDRYDAIDSYRSALKLLPEFTPAALQVAVAYDQAGNFPAAGQIFKDILQDHPEEAARAYLYTGYSLMRRNSWNAALAAFEKAEFKTRKGLGNGTLIFLRGLCYERLGRADEARAAFRDVIDNWPDATLGAASVERLVFPAYEGLGRLQLEAHDTEQAQIVMEEGIARTGASLELYLRLARLYLDYHLRDRARALVEEATARDLGPRNADLMLSAYLLWARIAREDGDRASLDRLVTSLDGQAERLAALHDYPRDLDAMRIYSIAGRPEGALPILKRGLKAGYVRIEWLAADPDLEPLRATPGYRELLRAGRPPQTAPPPSSTPPPSL